MIRKLTSVEEVFAELGGYQAVREMFGHKNTSTALMWNFRKKFPAKTFTVMKAALEAKGASAPETLWGMPESEGIGQP